jgi:ketosteroid isomerase-like protein
VPEEDFEAIRRAWAAFSRSDEEAMFAEFHADIVAIPFGAAMEGKSYRGLDEVRHWWQHEILATWETYRVLPEEFRRVGDKILVTGRFHARGKESGVQLDMPATWVIEVRDGKMAYWQTYTDHSQALRDIGLEP